MNMTTPQTTQLSQKGNSTPRCSISVLKATAQVAVCTANQPASQIKITSAIVKLAPVIPKALVEHMVAFRPVSEPTMPPRIIMVQQMANPMRVAQKMELIVSTPPKMPPTISMGIQIMVPTQMKAILHQERFSLGWIWDRPLSSCLVSVTVVLFSSMLLFSSL